MGSLSTGTIAGAGSFRCRRCGYTLTLESTDALSDCPGCGGHEFVRASLFNATGFTRHRMQESACGPPAPGPVRAGRMGAGPRAVDGLRAGEWRRETGEWGRDADTMGATGALGGMLSRPEPVDSDAWLERAREQIDEPGEHLAYEDSGEVKTVALTREWTRIGRSLVADMRFDDPTVSRRHALIVRQADGVRLLDDRSLNGVFVNGSRVEWKVLEDGDEIVVGRYRLRFLSVAPEHAGALATAALEHVG